MRSSYVRYAICLTRQLYSATIRMRRRIAARNDAPRDSSVASSILLPAWAKEAGRGDGRGFAAPGLLRERHGASVWPCDLLDRRLLGQGAKQQRVCLLAAPHLQPALKCSKQFVRVIAAILGLQS